METSNVLKFSCVKGNYIFSYNRLVVVTFDL